MIWLFFSIVLDFGFVQLFKLAQRRGYYAPVVVSANYITVTISIGLYLIFAGSPPVPAAASITGVVTGLVFISSMLLMNHMLTVAPVGSVLTAFRLSIVVHVVLGVWVWDESMSWTQFGGLVLALFALVLMTGGKNTSTRHTGLQIFGLLAIVCLWQGVSHTCLRSVHYNGLDAVFLHVLMITGATAGTIGSMVIIVRKHRPQKPAIYLGIFIGLYNAVALAIIMTALSQLPGTLFYPIMGCSVVLLDNLFAHFYWKERLARPAIAGVGLAIVSLTLVI